VALRQAKHNARTVKETAHWAGDWFRQFSAVRFVLTFFTIWSRRRGFGFSAEAAFWGTFTLPWLFLGLLAAVSYAAGILDEDDVVAQVEEVIKDTAYQVLTPDAVNSYLIPLLDFLSTGNNTLSIISLIVALWSGSRVFATFVEGSAVINVAPRRSYLRTRGIALSLYVLGLLALLVMIIGAFLFRDLWRSVFEILPGPATPWAVAVALASLAAIMTTMMWLANPRRGNWLLATPGGIVGMLIWLGGSLGLQLYFSWIFRTGSVYGTIAAPLAIMLWIFVATIAVFVGITVNATIVFFKEVAESDRQALDHREDVVAGIHDSMVAMAATPELGPRPSRRPDSESGTRPTPESEAAAPADDDSPREAGPSKAD